MKPTFKRERKSTCSRCGNPKEESRGKQALCHNCHAENMRVFRIKKRSEYLEMKEMIARLTA